MRKNLENLRGQLVAWKGWETNSRYNNTWACISKATVTPWRFNIPIQKSFTKDLTKVDHFWLTTDQKNNIQQESMQYEKLGGIGIVKSYMRKDGSIDYTLKMPSNMWSIEDFIDLYNDEYKQTTPKQKIQRLSEGLKNIKQHETDNNHILYGLTRSVKSLKKELEEEKKFIENSVEATDKALKTVKMNGKCKNLNLIQFPKRKSTKSKSF